VALDDNGKGETPMMVLDRGHAKSVTGPACVDGIGPAADWQGYYQKIDLSKRQAASWGNGR
jgi:hypothetical protein